MALSQCIKRRNLAQKIFEFHAGVKKCHFGNFSARAGMAVPCQCSPQESLVGSEKFFLHWVPMNSQQCWKAKLERAYSFRVQSCKILVCVHDSLHCLGVSYYVNFLGGLDSNGFHLAPMIVEEIKILGAVLELPAKQHCQFSPLCPISW